MCDETRTGSAPSTTKKATFSDDEPAFRQATRMASVGPDPVADLGQILEVLAHVKVVARQHLVAVANQLIGTGRSPPRTVDREVAQVVPAHIVEHDHVERCSGRSFLEEAAHMKAPRIALSVDQFVERTRVTVKREDHIAIGGEEV